MHQNVRFIPARLVVCSLFCCFIQNDLPLLTIVTGIVAADDVSGTVISLLLSLESVFATISGAAILGDRLSGREYFGCALMLAAVVLAQLPDRKKA